MKAKPQTVKGWFLVNDNGEPLQDFYYQKKWVLQDKKRCWMFKNFRIVYYRVSPIRRKKCRSAKITKT